MRENHKFVKFSALALIAGAALPAVTAATAAAQSAEYAKPAGRIFTDAITAMQGLKDFYVTGSIKEGAQTVSLQVALSAHGGGGTVSTQGATLNVVANKKALYIKADKHSWQVMAGNATGSAAVVARLAGKWVKVPVTNASFGSFANFAFSTKFLGSVTAQKMTFTKNGETTKEGRSAIVLKDSEGTNIYVAARSPHYLLGVAGTEHGSDNASGKLKFSDFGSAALPATPVAALTLPS